MTSRRTHLDQSALVIALNGDGTSLLCDFNDAARVWSAANEIADKHDPVGGLRANMTQEIVQLLGTAMDIPDDDRARHAVRVVFVEPVSNATGLGHPLRPLGLPATAQTAEVPVRLLAATVVEFSPQRSP